MGSTLRAIGSLCIAVLVPLAGCKDVQGTSGGFGTGGDATASSVETDAPPPTDTSTGGGTTGGGASEDSHAAFDLPVPDAGAGPATDGIPRTCDEAQDSPSSLGCVFYTVQLDATGAALLPYGATVANIHDDRAASVVAEVRTGDGWQVVAGPVEIEPLGLHAFTLPDLEQTGSGLGPGGAYRLTADVPIAAYQYNPISDSGSFSSDASLLYPVSAWDTLYHAVGWKTDPTLNVIYQPYVTIVAAFDDTMVEVSTNVMLSEDDAGIVPVSLSAQTFSLTLDAGDIFEVMKGSLSEAGLAGMRIAATDGKPIAVFSGSQCARIPAGVIACDHLEEQLSGLHSWGTHFVAPRMPVRDTGNPEVTYWHVYASEDGTTVDFLASAAVTGLPSQPVVLDRGEQIELEVSGSPADPGDFEITANRPIAVMHYMSGRGNVSISHNDGDPAMAQITPTQQYRSRYVILVPDKDLTDILMVTRPLGTQVWIDGDPVGDVFEPVGDGAWEVARMEVHDGVHRVEGDLPIGIELVGYGTADSYAFLGGTRAALINPAPAG